MDKRMNMESVYHKEAFLEIMQILGKYRITDCCLGVVWSHSTNPKNTEVENKNG